MSETKEPAYEGWAILELMGHRRLAGRVAEATVAGSAFVRIDVPSAEGTPAATQFYSPQAVYCLTPCTEETARTAAGLGRVAPVQRWELPAPAERPRQPDHDDEGCGDSDLTPPF